jgi:hypothetical protein
MNAVSEYQKKLKNKGNFFLKQILKNKPVRQFAQIKWIWSLLFLCKQNLNNYSNNNSLRKFFVLLEERHGNWILNKEK